MEQLLNEALVNGILIPLAAGLVVTAALRFGLGGTKGPATAGAAIGVAFIVGFALLAGWPDFPPKSSGQKIGYIVLFGVIIGFVLDLLDLGSRLRWLLFVAAPAGIVGWLGWRIVGGLEISKMLPHVILFLAGIFVFNRLSASYSRQSTPTVLLLVTSIGASLIALLGASASVAQQFGLAAAAIGGFLLWNWPAARFPFGAGALLGCGGAILALVSMMILFTEASPLATAFLLFVFLAPAVADKLPFRDNNALAPIVLGITAAIPALVGIAIAFALGSGSGGSGYG